MAEQVKTAKKSRPKSRGINLAVDILIYIFVGLVSLTCVLPYIHVIAKSFSSESFVIAKKVFLLPKGFTPEAYIKIFHDNSFIVSFGSFPYDLGPDLKGLALQILCLDADDSRLCHRSVQKTSVVLNLYLHRHCTRRFIYIGQIYIGPEIRGADACLIQCPYTVADGNSILIRQQLICLAVGCQNSFVDNI